jgi:Domain of unknown function (DUF3850)
MTTHFLKCIEPYFTDVKNGLKDFEFRIYDRDFAVGDRLVLQEYDPITDTYGAEEIRTTIKYMLPISSLNPIAVTLASYAVLGLTTPVECVCNYMPEADLYVES